MYRSRIVVALLCLTFASGVSDGRFRRQVQCTEADGRITIEDAAQRCCESHPLVPTPVADEVAINRTVRPTGDSCVDVPIAKPPSMQVAQESDREFDSLHLSAQPVALSDSSPYYVGGPSRAPKHAREGRPDPPSFRTVMRC